MYLSSDPFASIQYDIQVFPSFLQLCAQSSQDALFLFLLALTPPVILPDEGLQCPELPSCCTVCTQGRSYADLPSYPLISVLPGLTRAIQLCYIGCPSEAAR